MTSTNKSKQQPEASPTSAPNDLSFNPDYSNNTTEHTIDHETAKPLVITQHNGYFWASLGNYQLTTKFTTKQQLLDYLETYPNFELQCNIASAIAHQMCQEKSQLKQFLDHQAKAIGL